MSVRSGARPMTSRRPSSFLPTAATAAGGSAAAAPAAPAAAVPAGEIVEVATDRVKASFDSIGGTLVRLELLDYRDNADRSRNVVLFERDGKRLYLAQTGLISTQPGLALPTHLTPMSVAVSSCRHDTVCACASG